MVRRLLARLTSGRTVQPSAQQPLEPEAIQHWGDKLRSQLADARSDSEDLREKYKDVPLRVRRSPKKASATSDTKTKSTGSAQNQPPKKKPATASKRTTTKKQKRD